MTVLFVDDQPDFLKLLEARLKSEDYDKIYCLNGDEAWHILNTRNIDVIISDINMPQMGGLELLERCMKKFPDVVRVALTSMKSPGLILDAFNHGLVQRYLSKPWRVDAGGKQQIREFLELRRSIQDKIDRESLAKALMELNIRIVERNNTASSIHPISNRYALLAKTA